MKSLRNLRRVDSGRFRGWIVIVKRRQERFRRYFWDRRHGGKRAAYGKALAYRDWLEARLEPPNKMHKTATRNPTGVVGLYYGFSRDRKGKRCCYYYAGTWVDEHWRTRSRKFAVAKYGRQHARELALQARREAVERILEARRAALQAERRRRRARTKGRSS